MTDRLVTPIEGTLDADVRVPGSKSITNRALITAALAGGTSRLVGAGLSDDTEAMISALQALGARIDVGDTEIAVHGTGGRLTRPGGPLDARQSGTTARFVTPLLLLSGGGSIDGHDQLRRRPMADQVAALQRLGARITGDRLPLWIEVGELGSATEIDGSVSSQFTSGLLLVGPCLPEGLELRRVGVVVSEPYVDMTIALMRRFGAEVDVDGDTITVRPTGYRGCELTVEPDASTATYPLAAAAIVGGRVRVLDLGTPSIQGDSAFTAVLERMGAEVRAESDSIEVRGSGTLLPIHADLGAMSDTAPTFAALAARASGRSSASGIGFIRTTKESDRVAAAVTELRRLGIDADIDEDGFSVTGGPHRHAAVETYDDHRMAMGMALLGLVDEPVTITGSECVAKTFPGFFDLLDELRQSARTEALVLAIDGPAGSGKSTVAAAVAERLHLPHLDTGAMYRSVTLAVLRSGVSIDAESEVGRAARSAEIHVGPKVVMLDGEDVTTEIRSNAVTSAVSPVATIGAVRAVLASRQRAWAQARGAAVVEGRDIGSAVFPAATLKVFLTASVEERARRRAAEIGFADHEEMVRRITERDRIDSTRAHDPLTIAPDAVVIDSTELSVDAVVDRIVELWGETPAA